MTAGFDPYKVLQVDPEAEDEVIQAAYRRLAQKYHPDRGGGPEAAARMVQLNAAWQLVGSPDRRAEHDRGRAAGSPPLRPSPAGEGVAGTHVPPPARRAETVSRDWTSGRSDVGGRYDPSMRAPDGLGAAGPPPGNPSGSVLNFGRYAGWSLGEISRRDLEYVEWLDRMPIGRTYRDEIDAILRRTGRRRAADAEATQRRGLFRRR